MAARMNLMIDSKIYHNSNGMHISELGKIFPGLIDLLLVSVMFLSGGKGTKSLLDSKVRLQTLSVGQEQKQWIHANTETKATLKSPLAEGKGKDPIET